MATGDKQLQITGTPRQRHITSSHLNLTPDQNNIMGLIVWFSSEAYSCTFAKGEKFVHVIRRAEQAQVLNMTPEREQLQSAESGGVWV